MELNWPYTVIAFCVATTPTFDNRGCEDKYFFIHEIDYTFYFQLTRSFLDKLEAYHNHRREELNWTIEIYIVDNESSYHYSEYIWLHIRPYGVELDFYAAQNGGVGTGSANLRDNYNQQ